MTEELFMQLYEEAERRLEAKPISTPKPEQEKPHDTRK